MGLQVTITYQPVPRKNIWRVLHDKEIAKLGIKPLWRPGMPEVHPLFPNHHSPFQAWAQLRSWELNSVWMDKYRWTDIYHHRYWITNDQGFGDENSPRANFILGKDTLKELPRVEALVCGGSLIEGERNGDWVRVKGLHFNTPVSAEFMKTHPQFWVRGVYAGGTGQPFRMLGDKYEGEAIIHPLIVNESKGDLFIQANKLQAWTSNETPDPLKIYI